MNYPYSREQIALLFRRRPERGQSVYNFRQSKQYLKREMENMDQYGYDFAYKQWKFKKSKRRFKRKIMRRRVYTRINCTSSCLMKKKHSHKNEKQGGQEQFQGELQKDSQNPPIKVPKRWTTYYGCAEIRFAVVQLKQFLKKYPHFQSKQMTAKEEVELRDYPKIVLWDLYIYRQECKQCRKYGYTEIYHCQMQAIAKAFCKIIAEILANIQQEKYVQDDQKTIKEPPQHETLLCEACKKNVCFWLIWKKKYDQQQRRLELVQDTSSDDEESGSSGSYQSDEDNQQNGSHDEQGDDQNQINDPQ